MSSGCYQCVVDLGSGRALGGDGTGAGAWTFRTGGHVFQAEGTAGAEALRGTEIGVLGKLEGDPCGVNVKSRGAGEGGRGSLVGVGGSVFAEGVFLRETGHRWNVGVSGAT